MNGRVALQIVLVATVGLATAVEPVELRAQQREVARLLSASYVFVGQGSGVLISATGEILTNHHVAGDQREWRVRLADGRSFPAHHVATDPVGDICLLRIEAPDDTVFTHVTLGSAELLRPGLEVLAIGNPFGLGELDNTPTVTAGTLGTGRIVRGDYSDCVQLDAPVNPGNSGGPLLDQQGRLLGINGQIRTRTGMRANTGIGLAIACTQLAAFLPVMRDSSSGWVHHSRIPERLGLEQLPDGVMVARWQARDDAEQELLQCGDRLLRVAGRPVTSLATAVGLFGSLPWTGEGMTVPALILRDGSEREVAIPVERRRIAQAVDLGLRCVRRDGPGDNDLLLVGSVEPGSPAARAGISVGWIVLSVAGRSIESRLDLLKALAPLDVGDRIAIRFQDHETKAEVEKTVVIGE